MTASTWPTTLAAYRKAIPQVAVVAGYAWVVISDRLTTGGPLDGVTLVAACLALLQGLLVVVPANPWAKALWSLGAVAGQALTAVVSDGHPSSAEIALLIGAVIAWAAGAGATNVRPGGIVGPVAPAGTRLYDRTQDGGHIAVGLLAAWAALILAVVLVGTLIAVITPTVGTNGARPACAVHTVARPWQQITHDTCRRQNWRGSFGVRVRGDRA